MVSTVAASSDNVFGPQVSASVRSFDFTLLFEDCILSLVPSLLLILVAAPRFLYLYGTRRKVIWPELRIVKTCTLVLFFSLQVAVLSLWTLPSSPRSSISIVSAAFGVVEAIGIGSLSTVEHNHSAHPSTILSIYLLFSTVFGAARSRTLWLIRSDLKLSLVFTLSTSVKAILLVLESKEKRRHLQHDIVDCTAEATSGIYSRITFWWLNPLLVKGFKSKISVDDLSHVSVHLQRKSSLLDVEANAKKGVLILN
jgi:ATP-binding cassette, subfamily C (CFTR/MRP), member 1